MYLEGKVAVVAGPATDVGEAIPVRFTEKDAFQNRTSGLTYAVQAETWW